MHIRFRILSSLSVFQCQGFGQTRLSDCPLQLDIEPCQSAAIKAEKSRGFSRTRYLSDMKCERAKIFAANKNTFVYINKQHAYVMRSTGSVRLEEAHRHIQYIVRYNSKTDLLKMLRTGSPGVIVVGPGPCCSCACAITNQLQSNSP